MATIQFENGTKVNFEGTPTPKDVEEVAAQMKLSKGSMPATPSLPKPTSLGSKAKSLVGGVTEGLGGTLPLLAIDYLGKKIVEKNPFSSPETKERQLKNLSNSPSQSQRFEDEFGKKDNPVSYGVGEGLGIGAGLVTGTTEAKTAIKGTPIVKSYLEKKGATKLSDTTGTILQGDLGDIPKAKSALSQIDTSKVKTYEDLTKALDNKITTTSGLLDKTLETSPITKKLGELKSTITVGDKAVKHNYVEDAFDDLKKFYLKTNDVENFAGIRQLEAKAKKDGLTIKELNDLARVHGRDLNAFNANGELASGLTKQAAENTRTGLKTTARDLFGDKIYKNADENLSNLIRTRELAEKMTEKVNDLRQKVQQRGAGERVGRLLGTVVNTLALNSPKGFIEYFLGRGTGLKTLNALDLEKQLAKNLKKLQNLTEGSEADIVKKLEAYLAEIKN